MVFGNGARTPDFRKLVNADEGLVDRQIFSDEEIYRLELERIFARAWNFMCHESQLKKAGDFFLTYIGEDSVIVVRDKAGAFQVLLNTCRHRGNAVCRAEQGNAKSFLCTYHGWTYGLDGKLIGVPGYKDLYHEDLDRDKWGLVRAAKVDSYKGFVFATMDPDAPDLSEYLGETGRMGIDLIAARGPLEFVEGVAKNVVGCNWKLPTDNNPDFYHSQVTHASAMQAGGFAIAKRVQGQQVAIDVAARTAVARHTMFNYQRTVFGRYGHFIGGPRIPDEINERLENDPNAAAPEIPGDINWRYTPEGRAQLGPVGVQAIGHPGIFPNLFITQNMRVCLRLPRGPRKTELWWFTLIDRDIPVEERAPWIDHANHVFGPAGLFEQEDGENWEQGTRATKGVVSRRYPFNYSMNLGHGKVEYKGNSQAPFVDSNMNEHAQLWLYRAWADWMSANDWAELKETASPLPKTVA